MSDETSDRSAKLPLFDGKKGKFQMWWTRFQAYARVHKFTKALRPGGEPDLPDKEDEDIPDSDSKKSEKEAARKRNDMAVANLTMAFQTDKLLGLVYKSQDDNWPGGKAHLIVERMMKKYMPKDTMSRVEMRQGLNKVSMKKDEDPTTLFEQLSAIENAYNTESRKIDEDDLVAVILDKAPKEYKSVITAEQQARGENLTLDDLEKAMDHLYRQMHPGIVDNDENELALSAFSGKCYKCHEVGHKANNCPKRGNKGGGGRKFKGKCHQCGKEGHRKADCWVLDENAPKHPRNWWSATERSNAAIQSGTTGSSIEILLCGVDKQSENGRLTFPKDMSLLKHPNVWIADTGATCHATPHQLGKHTMKNATTKDGITYGTGKAKDAQKVRSITGTLCDKNGNNVGHGTMSDVAYVSNSAFNLYSLTRMIKYR